MNKKAEEKSEAENHSMELPEALAESAVRVGRRSKKKSEAASKSEAEDQLQELPETSETVLKMW